MFSATGIKIKKSRYGLLSDGKKVHLYTISNGKMQFSVTDYGCIITSILLPDGKKGCVDVALGFSTLEGFVNNDASFGAVVGRFANRIGGASFSLDGTTYSLDKNDNKVNTLHGGFDRWDKIVWKVEKVSNDYGAGVKFTHKSPDGEQGFPGNGVFSVTYTLNADNDLTLLYEGEVDKACPVNLTNHSYFNLAGQNSGSIGGHSLQMNCSRYLEVDSELIPTGKCIDVKGTPYDFTTKKRIGDGLPSVGVGYDHCFCVDGYADDGALRTIATLEEPESGRKMIVRSTLPGVQFYSGNYIENIKGKNGFVYHAHDALCLETEAYPDAPNKVDFPSSIVRPGQKYNQVTQYAFVF